MNTENTVSEYDKQAADFLAKNGIKIRITLSDSKTPAWSEDGKHGHHYRVTLSKSYKTKGIYPARLTFDFWGSIHDADSIRKNAAKVERLIPEVARIRQAIATAEHYANQPGREEHAKTVVALTPTLAEKERILAEARALAAATPSAYDVLACISGDTYTPDTFADFCGEFGYETDSIKALQTFRRCSTFAKRLRAFFTTAELEQLAEIR
jgi:hypothetical protein